MDEQRLQAYLNLIQSLLSCPSGEESQILQVNFELVDAGLVQVMLERTNDLRTDNNLDDANSLITLAGHLMGTYGNTMPDKSSPSTYRKFLTEVLQVTADSNGDRNLIYALLRDNLNLINDNLAVELPNLVIETLQNLDSQTRCIYMLGDVVNFSLAIAEFPLGSRASNLEIAIAGYKIALTVFTRQEYPEDWANTQNNLANAYSNRIRGEKAENLEIAIATYQASLEVYTREAFPEYWARSQNNLGSSYSERIIGEKAENLELGISAYQAALKIRTREAFPIDHAETLYGLGLSYWYNSQLPEAYNTFNTAIETVESMRRDIIIGGEVDRQKLAEEWNKLYQGMVKVCLDMENKTAALEYIERSKTRNLVELFHNARNLPENAQRISFQEIRSLLGEDEAILEWYITFNGFKVFIITRNSTQPDIWHSSSEDLQALEKFQQEYIDDYINQPDNWRNQLETRLEKLATILQIDKTISRLPENCQRLILVPFRYLHLLPLHALTSRRLRQNAEETGSLLELFPGGVRYTPSCQLLQLSQRVNPTGEESSPTRLFAIQNPTEDLDFTDIEVEAIAKSFNPAEVLIREKASKTGLQQQLAGLQNADIAHFSCHGFFDFSNPRKSALILAGAKIATDNVNSEEKSYIRSRRGETFDIAECLTLEEIFDLSLSKCSLVTLSACETGLTDIRDNTDEYIGLPRAPVQ